MVWESFDMVRYYNGGQMRKAKLKSAYTSFVIGPSNFKPTTYRKSWAGSHYLWSGLAILEGQTG